MQHRDGRATNGTSDATRAPSLARRRPWLGIASAGLAFALGAGATAAHAAPRAQPVVVVPSGPGSGLPSSTDAAATPRDGGAAPATAAAVSTPGLRPHVLTFAVSFKGIGAGTIELRLTREGTNLWRYETRPQPSMLARMIVSASSIERGTFTLGPDGVEPRDYSLDDGTPKRTKDEVSLEYDRAAGRVRGFARGEPLDLPLVPRLQDPLSIRAALLSDLLAGREPGEYPMIDGRHIETFVYRRVGPEKLKTALGQLDTVVYTSSRKGADARAKTWKYWYAPSLGWLPVRIEQRDADGPRLVFTVRSAVYP